MSTHALTYTLLHGRSSRAFFLARSTQQVRSARRLGQELARAAVALGALTAWAGVALLLAG
jgi:hypothetical protein